LEVAESDGEPDVYNDEKCAGAVVVKHGDWAAWSPMLRLYGTEDCFHIELEVSASATADLTRSPSDLDRRLST